MSSRNKQKALLLAATALFSFGVLRYFMPAKLSSVEQSLLGTWLDPATPPRNGGFVLAFLPDRTCVQRTDDGREMGPGISSMAGRWRVEDGVLVCVWLTGFKAYLPDLPGTGSVRRRSSFEGRLTAITEEELTVQWPDGQTSTWKRQEM